MPRTWTLLIDQGGGKMNAVHGFPTRIACEEAKSFARHGRSIADQEHYEAARWAAAEAAGQDSWSEWRHGGIVTARCLCSEPDTDVDMIAGLRRWARGLPTPPPP